MDRPNAVAVSPRQVARANTPRPAGSELAAEVDSKKTGWWL